MQDLNTNEMKHNFCSVQKNIENIVLDTIEKRGLLAGKSHVLLMVSGGADSVALAYIFKHLYSEKSNIAVMHLNHNLRGEEAQADAEFVEGLANFLDLKFFSYSEDIAKIASQVNHNVEACARDIRYKCANDALNNWANSEDIELKNFVIATAHNADDRIENFYMRSIVGTGPGGFYSISYKRDNLIRPLLDVEKSQIKAYVKELDNTYVDNNNNRWHEDSTNKDTNRFRAFVRQNIVPQARQYNKNLASNLCTTMNLIADENNFMNNLTMNLYKNLCEQDAETIKINIKIAESDIVLQRRLAYMVLRNILPEQERINNSSVESIIKAFKTHNYTDNIQGDLIVHSNNRGITITPSLLYRKSRNRLDKDSE